MAHICVSKLTIIGSDNGLSPGRRQAIIWTNAGILLIRTFGTHFSEILGEIHSFSFSKMHLKMSSAKWRLFVLGLNELKVPLDDIPWVSMHLIPPITWVFVQRLICKQQRQTQIAALLSLCEGNNYADPLYGVATICHQVRCLRWGHPSLFHTAMSLLIWYKNFCMRDI